MGIFGKILSEASNRMINNISDNIQSNVINKVVDTAKDAVIDKQIVGNSEYTLLPIFGATLKFKKAESTLYWDCEDNFGAGEIDTVFVYSETGAEPADTSSIYGGDPISGITFSTNWLDPENPAEVKRKLNSVYGITDVTITKSDNPMFMNKIKGESDRYYFESYYMEYEGDLDGEKSDIYYEIYLALDKRKISPVQLNLAIGEYHLMIKTMEFVKGNF